MQTTLRKSGFDVAIAPDALSAVSQARAHRPALVILDLGLPAGGGFMVMERLRSLSHLAGTPVLVVSGQDRVTMEKPALEAGAVEYLSKPASPEQILASVRRILASEDAAPHE